MKKLLFLIVSALLLSAAMPAMAQTSPERMKERRAITQNSRKELDKKASKAAKAEAKRLKKEGWTVAPGALPLDKQLDRAYMMQYEYDDNMMPRYMMGEGMSIGTNYDAARMQATELAKQNLAGQIQTEVTALIENTVANEQLSAGEAESITRSIAASKDLISQSLGRTITVTEVYRVLPNGNKEVLIRLAYSTDQALAITKRIVQQDLENRGEQLHGKLDELLGW